MVTKTPRIQIDHREKASGIIELIAQKEVEIEVKQLLYGDYIVNDDTVIERKSAQDFVVSIVDGRLFRQCHLMRERADNPLLLVEGDPYGTTHQMDRRAIQGAIISVCAVWRIPMLFVDSPAETAQTIALLAHQKREERIAVRTGYKPKTVRKRRLYILQGLPGIGPKSAKNLLDYFGSVERVIAAEADELRQIEGIGKVTAQRIREIVTERNSYFDGDE